MNSSVCLILLLFINIGLSILAQLASLELCWQARYGLVLIVLLLVVVLVVLSTCMVLNFWSGLSEGLNLARTSIGEWFIMHLNISLSIFRQLVSIDFERTRSPVQVLMLFSCIHEAFSFWRYDKGKLKIEHKYRVIKFQCYCSSIIIKVCWLNKDACLYLVFLCNLYFLYRYLLCPIYYSC